MARRKNQPESVRVKCHLSERLRAIRTELFGERGGSEMARRLELPVRTWYNYEGGVTVPAEVLLRFVELTSVEPMWLLHGKGPKYRLTPPTLEDDTATVPALLRTALERLERRGSRPEAVPRFLPPISDADAERGDLVLMSVEGHDCQPLTGPRYVAARRQWLDAERDCRCIRVDGDDMSPLVGDGACVAISDVDESPEQLDGKLVVAWADGRPVVRWLALTGRYAILRAENPAAATSLIDLSSPAESRRLRRVLWISTPH